MVEGMYQKDVSTGEIQAWDLEPYTNRAGHNTGLEKAGKNDQNFDALLKKLKNKNKGSETKAKEEQARKKTKSALEAKAAAETAEKSKKVAMDAEATTKEPPKKRKVAVTSAAKGTAEQPVKKSKGSEADR